MSLIISFTSAMCGMTLAFMGYGVWALVWSSLVSGFVGVIARWFIIAWRPKMMFSFQRLKPLFSYGWKMAFSALLDQFFVNLNSLLIGKLYTKADLAYVNKGHHLPSLAMEEVDGTLARVSLPALVLLQDDKAKLRDAMRRMIQCSTFLVFPLMVGVAACSYSLLRLLYGPQWTSAAPYMMLACFSFALRPFSTINLRGIIVLGRSDVFLKLEIIKKSLQLLCIIMSIRYGVFVFMATSAFALGPLCVLINAWPNRKLLGYTIAMQLHDVLPTALICIAEAVVVWGIDLLGDAFRPFLCIADEGVSLMVFLGLKLMLQFLFGSSVFLGLSYVFRLKPMGEYARMVAGVINNCMPRLAVTLESRFCD